MHLVLPLAAELAQARTQMALTLGFHIILASLGVAFPAMMLIANYRGLRKNNRDALQLAEIGVAIAAGVAGMLAFETRASAAVGVAISVTTIPAAAYLGVSMGVGEGGKVPGTLAVLAVNVTLLLLSGTTTLVVQRWIGRRAASGR